jgi:general secretion pathway protein G
MHLWIELAIFVGIATVISFVIVRFSVRFLATGKDLGKSSLLGLYLVVTAVTVPIIFLLVVVVSLVLHQSRERAQNAKYTTVAQQDLQAVKMALQRYKADIGDYPSPQQHLHALTDCPMDLRAPDKWKGPYLDHSFMDPWGGIYEYAFDSTQENPRVWCAGPDGVDGTGDDISAQAGAMQ